MSTPEITLLAAAGIWILGPIALIGAGLAWQRRKTRRQGRQVAADAEQFLRERAQR